MATRCECGGEFKATTVATYDFTPIAGIPAQLKNVRALVCARCGGVTLDGRIINVALNAIAIAITRLPSRLTHERSRFLRRRLGLSQQALAERMGIDRVTVAKWETSGEISPQHDHMLRGLVLAHCARTAKRLDPAAMVEALSSVHREPTPEPAPPIVIDRRRTRARATAALHA